MKNLSRKSFRRKNNFSLSMLALPGVLLLLLFNYIPMVGIILAFKDFNPNMGIFKSPWVGLKNFEFLFASQDALRIIRNTLGYSTAFIILDSVISSATSSSSLYIFNCSLFYSISSFLQYLYHTLR